jgi:hypothetical protein
VPSFVASTTYLPKVEMKDEKEKLVRYSPETRKYKIPSQTVRFLIENLEECSTDLVCIWAGFSV